mmetsp:Transcript_2007/g.6028  ORF Transcript_2007/g.6028 Transcript_2007/m.6028 type:complete len:536 (+) Transcript_2007:215-1822(+)
MGVGFVSNVHLGAVGGGRAAIGQRSGIKSARVGLTRVRVNMGVDGGASSDGPRPVCPVLMGSASDMSRCEAIGKALGEFGIDAELRIASAHKVPERLLEVIRAYEEDPRPKVYIAVAGRSNALSGVLDCATTAPVISCPPYSDAFGGADLFSSIRMPGGVAPSLVLDPAGAALMAAKILGVSNPAVRDAVAALQRRNRDRLYIDDGEATSKRFVPMIQSRIKSGEIMTQTDLKDAIGASEKRSGKVRDQYVVGDQLVLVTTDRQSAFDRVLAAIPFKGQVLNMTSAWWFRNTEHIVPNHVQSIPHPYVTVAKKCSPFPVEFVVRGYITGSTSTSLWTNYNKGVRNYCGIDFPDGLIKNQKLDENVLTPTTKEDYGDENISPADIISKGLMSKEDFDVCAKAAMELFAYGQKVASEHGLILVDTKYEFGKDENGTIRLIDEIHTPDSSRFWLAPTYDKRMAEGKNPENVDKEFLRLWFQDNCDPYKDEKLPEAPEDLVTELARRYIMLFQTITWEDFDASATPPTADAIKKALKKH